MNYGIDTLLIINAALLSFKTIEQLEKILAQILQILRYNKLQIICLIVFKRFKRLNNLILVKYQIDYFKLIALNSILRKKNSFSH